MQKFCGRLLNSRGAAALFVQIVLLYRFSKTQNSLTDFSKLGRMMDIRERKRAIGDEEDTNVMTSSAPKGDIFFGDMEEPLFSRTWC